VKKFDMNIEKVLEHWSVAHAIREVIANALDESSLTGTEAPTITKTQNGVWNIRDFGRGIHYSHLTQNENLEKIKQPEKVIGKFGVGLKDAMATFDRNNIDIDVKSKHGNITINQEEKHGFENIKTLHAIINETSNPDFVGTDFQLKNVSDKDIEEAKNFFLLFSDEVIL